MNSALLAILSIIGLLALYWALFGQWKYNKMMREAETPHEIKNEEKPIDKTK